MSLESDLSPAADRMSEKARATRRSFGPFLAIIFVVSAIYVTVENLRNYHPSSPTTSDVKRQQESKREAASAPKPISSEVPSTIAPPVQPLEIPKLPPARAAPKLIVEREFEAASLDMVTPAPGCGSLPSYASVSKICRLLDQQRCDSNSLCSWGASACYPRQGAWASSNPLGNPGDVDYVQSKMDNFVAGKPSRLQIGDAHIVKRRFDRGIAEYTAVLQSDPNWPDVLWKRAMAYEASGNKPRAIADYCKILVIYSRRKLRAAAMERIAQLTQPQEQGINVPARVPMAADGLAKPGLPAPPTGDIQRRQRRGGIAPFSIHTNSGSNYLVKLVNVANSKDQIWVFVRGGEPYSTKVPIGNYALRVASGNTWYGREELFGPGTRFFRLRGKRGAAVDESSVLEFKKDRNRIMGMTLKFESSIDGNMEQESMTRSDFDAN